MQITTKLCPFEHLIAPVKASHWDSKGDKPKVRSMASSSSAAWVYLDSIILKLRLEGDGGSILCNQPTLSNLFNKFSQNNLRISQK